MDLALPPKASDALTILCWITDVIGVQIYDSQGVKKINILIDLVLFHFFVPFIEWTM